MISNREICGAKSEEQRQLHYLAVKKLSALLKGTTSKNNGDFLLVFILLEQKTNLNRIKEYVKIKIFGIL